MTSSPSNTVGLIYEPQSATVANGGNTSTPINIYGTTATGVIVPASIVGASLSFLVSLDDQNYYPLTDPDAGSPVIVILYGTSAQAIPLNAHQFFGWSSLKIVTSGNQIADKVFTIGVKAI